MRASSVLIVSLAVLVAGGVFWTGTAPLAARIDAARGERAALDAEMAALRLRIGVLAEGGESGTTVPVLAPDAEWTDAMLAAQDRLSMLAARHGVTLSGFSEAVSPDGLSQPAFALRAEGEGPYEAVVVFLAALEAEVPALGLSQLSLRPSAGASGMTELAVVAWGFLDEGRG